MMADGLRRALGIQDFHDVSQTHLGLNILFTSSQHSENRKNTELRQKFRTHYSLLRSQPRLKSSPLLCHHVFRKDSLSPPPPHPPHTHAHTFFPPICTLHVFVSCFVSKSPSSHIWSRYGAPQDNSEQKKVRLFDTPYRFEHWKKSNTCGRFLSLWCSLLEFFWCLAKFSALPVFHWTKKKML